MKRALCTLFALFTISIFAQGIDIENGEFILGFYSADRANETNFQLIKATGMNFVHSYGAAGFSDATIDEHLAFCDLAEKHGLKVMLDFGGRNWFKDETTDAAKQKKIDAFKNHPALGMWYLYDEPKIELVPKIQEIRKVLKEANPAIPSTLVIHWIKDWQKTRVACDLLMVDLYPVRNQEFPDSPLSNYTSYVNHAINLKDPSPPIIGVMQTMSWECFRYQLKHSEDTKYRFPNLIEMDNMGYASIAMGVRGLFFYSFYHIHTEPSYMDYHPHPDVNMDWYIETFIPFIKEIKEFTTLVHPSWNVDERSNKVNRDNKIFLGYWERKTGNYLLVCNDSKENRDLSIDLSSLDKIPTEASLKEWGRTNKKEVSLKNNTLNVKNVEPWESLIWEVK